MFKKKNKKPSLPSNGPAHLQEVPSCKYDPETGKLLVKPGGTYIMHLKGSPDMTDELWEATVKYFRGVCVETMTTFILHSPGRPKKLVSFDENLEATVEFTA